MLERVTMLAQVCRYLLLKVKCNFSISFFLTNCFTAPSSTSASLLVSFNIECTDTVASVSLSWSGFSVHSLNYEYLYHHTQIIFPDIFLITRYCASINSTCYEWFSTTATGVIMELATYQVYNFFVKARNCEGESDVVAKNVSVRRYGK